jgi:hypothetical protein
MPTPDSLSHAEMAALNFATAYIEENEISEEELMVTPGVAFGFLTMCVTSAVCRTTDGDKLREAFGIELDSAGPKLTMDGLLNVRKNALRKSRK